MSIYHQGRGDIMASELIKAVLDAEKECKQKESDARKKAEDKKQSAILEAREIVENAEKQTDKMLKDDKQAISGSSKRQLEKDKQKTKKECDEISAAAAKNLDRVTRLVIEMLTA